MRLFTYDADGRATPGIIIDGQMLDLRTAWRNAGLTSRGPASAGWLEFFQRPDWEDLAAALRAAYTSGRRSRAGRVPEPVRLLAPIPRPFRILAMARNYVAHAAEGPYQVPDQPAYFQKASTSVIGPDAPIVYPADVGRVDPEGELAFVIGRRCKRTSAAEAMDAVAGYTIVNDVSARDMQRDFIAKAYPFFRPKGIDTFCPLGPWIVLKDEIPDPYALTLTLRVNGEVRQLVRISDMLFKIPTIIEHVSRYITLEPGEIVATGTPSGIAPIHVGDVVEIEVDGIGVLRNPVVAGTEP